MEESSPNALMMVTVAGVDMTTMTSGDDEDTSLSSSDVTFYVFYYTCLGIIGVICIVGNSLVLAALLSHKRLRVPSNAFLISLAVADLLTGMVFVFYQVGHLELDVIKDSIGDWSICKVVLPLLTTGQTSSSFSLVGETLFRFISVTQPVFYHNHLTTGWTKPLLAVGFVWVMAMSIMFPIHIQDKPANYANVCRSELVYGGSEPLIVVLVIEFLVPLVIMTSMYAGIATELYKRKRRQVSATMPLTHTSSATDPDTRNKTAETLDHDDSVQAGGPTSGASHSQSVTRSVSKKRELRLVGMAAILLTYFTLSFSPFFIFAFTSILCSSCKVDRYFRAVVRLVLISNNAANVFIYAGRNMDFRSSFKRDLRKLRCIR